MNGLGLTSLSGGLGQQPDRMDAYIPGFIITVTTAALTANVAYLVRFQLSAPRTIQKLAIRTGATIAASSVELAIYSGTYNGTTFDKVATTGIITPATSSLVETALTTPFACPAGVPYWAVMGNNVGTNTIGRTAIDGTLQVPGNQVTSKTSAWSSGLPAQITAPLTAPTVCPWIGLVFV